MVFGGATERVPTRFWSDFEPPGHRNINFSCTRDPDFEYESFSAERRRERISSNCGTLEEAFRPAREVEKSERGKMVKVKIVRDKLMEAKILRDKIIGTKIVQDKMLGARIFPSNS